jgi:HSP90 family molecular chaperone
VVLQEDAQELADPIRLARLIKQYSQFIQFPIKLWSAKKEAKQVRPSTALHCTAARCLAQHCTALCRTVPT